MERLRLKYFTGGVGETQGTYKVLEEDVHLHSAEPTHFHCSRIGGPSWYFPWDSVVSVELWPLPLNEEEYNK